MYWRIVGSRSCFLCFLTHVFVLHLESLFVLVVLLPLELFLHLSCYFEVLPLYGLCELFRAYVLCVFVDRSQHADAIVLIFIGSFAIADGSNVLKFTLWSINYYLSYGLGWRFVSQVREFSRFQLTFRRALFQHCSLMRVGVGLQTQFSIAFLGRCQHIHSRRFMHQSLRKLQWKGISKGILHRLQPLCFFTVKLQHRTLRSLRRRSSGDPRRTRSRFNHFVIKGNKN